MFYFLMFQISSYEIFPKNEENYSFIIYKIRINADFQFLNLNNLMLADYNTCSELGDIFEVVKVLMLMLMLMLVLVILVTFRLM